MEILVALSDAFGPAQLTIYQPHRELKRYNVDTSYMMTLPSNEQAPGTDFNALLNMVGRHDLVITQRITSLGLMQMFRKACDLLGKPLILVTDDDYSNIPRQNPCYFGTALGGTLGKYRELQKTGQIEAAKALEPLLEQERVQGKEELKIVFSLPDHVITTTQELADTIRPWNKNISVFPNQVEAVFWEHDHTLEEMDESGHLKPIMNDFGLGTVPSFWPARDAQGNITSVNRIMRVGYTGTSSHVSDFSTIEEPWNKICEKYGQKVWFVYLGDPYFPDRQVKARNRRHWIPNAPYDIYVQNLRNIDIGIAPLLPDIFNQSKSELKALEMASHGKPCVLPNYITYSRAFTHGTDCLMYNNKKEFQQCIEELINNDRLRIKLGNNARQMVYEGRLEKHHGLRRFELYKSLIENSPGMKVLTPNKVA